MGTPSTALMRSPSTRPAFSAAEPATTPVTLTIACGGSLPGIVHGAIDTPRKPGSFSGSCAMTGDAKMMMRASARVTTGRARGSPR
jgi:hypothetical protein